MGNFRRWFTGRPAPDRNDAATPPPKREPVQRWEGEGGRVVPPEELQDDGPGSAAKGTEPPERE